MRTLLSLAVALAALASLAAAANVATTRPVIGVLTQPTGTSLAKYGPKYVAASYVKYLESAGARVVPVQHDAPDDVLGDYFDKLNGILLPGGDADLDNTTLYWAGKYFYDRSVAAYDQGDYFPVMGHCMGFELLSIITSQDFDILQGVDAENISLPLDFTSTAAKSRLFGDAPKRITDILGSQPVTMNNHMFSLYPSTFRSTPALEGFYHVLSENKDRNGQEFISTMEGQKYPIFAIQWHAEKPLFEWNPDEVINHSPDAIAAMQYMADTFVQQARLSAHRFPSEADVESAAIYNFAPVYTFYDEADFEQCYFFENWSS